MESHGIEMVGPFYVERGTLPVHQASFEGRLKYQTSDDSLYLATSSAWVQIQTGSDFDVGTIMLFGQNSAPTGWSKLTSWQNNSMIVFTTGNPASGGSQDATNPTMAGAGSHSHTVNSHNHSLGSHTHNIPAQGGSITYMADHNHAVNHPRTCVYGTTQGGPLDGNADEIICDTGRSGMETRGGGNNHDHGDTDAASGNTGNRSPGTNSVSNHTHTITSPYYRKVIAAQKN